MSTLLVLTAGQTDVQLVNGDARQELEPRQCSALHDEVESRNYELVNAPTRKSRERAGVLPDGDLKLCTPKLDAVLAKSVPTTALVLETRRDAKSAPGDPRLSGTILESRLRDKGVSMVLRRAYLEGQERLENRDEPRDSVIRREVVRRLERAVQCAIKAASPSRIVVAATGGFPVVSHLVEEIVRLHASVDVEALEVADGANAEPPTADRAVARTSVPEPLMSFQARRRVLELVGGGNLLGAWAVAEPLHGDAAERRWTQPVEWLARFASSLPMPDDCDVPLLKHPRMAVRAALRVELALRMGDVPRAVHGTVAFFEAALWDGLNERVERSKEPKRRRYFRITCGEAPSGKKLLRENDEDRSQPFELKDTIDGIDWYWIYDGDGGPAARLAKRFLKRDGLSAFEQALSNGVRALRNDVAHNEPTPELMNDARAQMQEAELWSDSDTFLSQSLVQGVLRELGEGEPGRLCEGLIAEVRRRLLEHDLTSSP